MSQCSPIHKFLLTAGIVGVAANLRPALTSVGPLVDYIRDGLGVSNVIFGLITTIPLLGFGLISFFIPGLGRRFGYEWAIFAGLIVLICGILFRAVNSVSILFLGAVLVGLGIAICNVLLPGFVKNKFPNQIGLMTSIYSTVMSIFASLGSGLSVPMVQSLGWGWQKAVGAWVILAVIAVLIWLPQLRSQRDKQGNIQPQTSEGEVWNSFVAWQVTLFMGFQSFGFYASVTWLPEILQDRGIDAAAAGLMLSIAIIIGLPTTFLAAFLADRLKDQRAIVVAISIFYFLGFGGLTFINEAALVFLWVICVGISTGASLSLSLAFLGLRTKTAHQAAKLSGMAQSIGYTIAAVGPLLLGLLFDATNSWNLPLTGLLLVGVFITITGLAAGRKVFV